MCGGFVYALTRRYVRKNAIIDENLTYLYLPMHLFRDLEILVSYFLYMP